jgi:hypothetical protein
MQRLLRQLRLTAAPVLEVNTGLEALVEQLSFSDICKLVGFVCTYEQPSAVSFCVCAAAMQVWV